MRNGGHRFEVSHVGLRQVRGQTLVAHQRSTGRRAADAVDYRERRNHKRVARGDQPCESRVRRLVGKHVDQRVCVGLDRGSRVRESGNVHHGEPASLVRRRNQRRQRGLAQGGELETVSAAVVVDDLDVVGAFRDPRVHERLGLLGAGDGGDLETVFGAVPAGRCGQRARRAQVGPVEQLAGRLVLLDLRGLGLGGEHVELGSDPEDQRLPQRLGTDDVSVSVEQARQQRLVGAIDHACARGRLDALADRGDLALAHQDAGALQHARAVENADVPDHQCAFGALGKRDRRQHGAKNGSVDHGTILNPGKSPC